MIGPDPRPLRDAGLSVMALPHGLKKSPPSGWDRWCHVPPTDAEFATMFEDGKKHNIAVACGPASGGTDASGEPLSAGLIVFVFNNRRVFDAFSAGQDFVRWTWVSESYRGPHVWIRLRDELPPKTLYYSAGPSFPSVLEVRTSGSYVVAPNSRHPKKVDYTWCRPRPPEIVQLDLDDLRLWFSERLYAAAERGWRLQEGPSHAAGIEESSREGQSNPNVPRVLPETVAGPTDNGAGERHYILVSLAGTLRRRGLEADEIAACLQKVNSRRCKPPCPEDDVKRIANSVAKYSTDQDFRALEQGLSTSQVDGEFAVSGSVRRILPTRQAHYG